MELFLSNLGRLRIIGFLEGISFLLLMGIGMPLKYFGGYENATYDLGMIHGILFILYVIAVFPAKYQLRWSIKTTLIILMASLFPFGTFLADAKILSIAMKKA